MNNNGKGMGKTQQAVRLGIKNGWTVKECAFYTNHSIKAIQNCCTRNKVVLAWGGNGRLPTPQRIANTKSFTQTQTQ